MRKEVENRRSSASVKPLKIDVIKKESVSARRVEREKGKGKYKIVKNIHV